MRDLKTFTYLSFSTSFFTKMNISSQYTSLFEKVNVIQKLQGFFSKLFSTLADEKYISCRNESTWNNAIYGRYTIWFCWCGKPIGAKESQRLILPISLLGFLNNYTTNIDSQTYFDRWGLNLLEFGAFWERTSFRSVLDLFFKTPFMKNMKAGGF